MKKKVRLAEAKKLKASTLPDNRCRLHRITMKKTLMVAKISTPAKFLCSFSLPIANPPVRGITNKTKIVPEFYINSTKWLARDSLHEQIRYILSRHYAAPK